jgi:hypothetical protein
MIKVAIDIGYGHTKVKTEDKELKFPTAVKTLKTQMIENNDYYLFEGKKYSVGEDALRGAISTRDYSFIYRYAPIIIHHALELLGVDPKEKIQISTGLSLYDMEKAAEFDSASANRKEEFKKDSLNLQSTTPSMNMTFAYSHKGKAVGLISHKSMASLRAETK